MKKKYLGLAVVSIFALSMLATSAFAVKPGGGTPDPIDADTLDGLDSTDFATTTYVDTAVANIELIPGPEGPVGPQGPQGEPGPRGEAAVGETTGGDGVTWKLEEKACSGRRGGVPRRG